jgi:chromosome segregation ATPase
MRSPLFRDRRPLLIVVCVLAGCGGSGGGDALTHAQYQQQVRRALAQLDSRIAALRANETAIAQLRTALGEAADRLDSLDAPSDADAANGELVDGLRAFEETIADEEETILRARGLEARALLARIAKSDGIARIQRAEADLREAGYTLPG